MGYSKRKPTYRILGGWVSIPWDLLNSAAYKELKPSAAKALPFFLGKVRHGKKARLEYDSHEYYESEFRYPFHEAKQQGFAPGTFDTIIEDLIDKGFVDPVFRGGRKSDGLGFSRFNLSPRWKHFGKPEFKRIDWNDFKIRKPRVRSMEEANAFIPHEALKHFTVSKTEPEQIQKLKRKRQQKEPISAFEAVGGKK